MEGGELLADRGRMEMAAAFEFAHATTLIHLAAVAVSEMDSDDDKLVWRMTVDSELSMRTACAMNDGHMSVLEWKVWKQI